MASMSFRTNPGGIVIEDGVIIGPGAKIIGKLVTIGKRGEDRCQAVCLE